MAWYDDYFKSSNNLGLLSSNKIDSKDGETDFDANTAMLNAGVGLLSGNYRPLLSTALTDGKAPSREDKLLNFGAGLLASSQETPVPRYAPPFAWQTDAPQPFSNYSQTADFEPAHGSTGVVYDSQGSPLGFGSKLRPFQSRNQRLPDLLNQMLLLSMRSGKL
jgi:hypothetical protein